MGMCFNSRERGLRDWPRDHSNSQKSRKYTCYRKGVINTGDLLVLGLSMWLRQKIEELTRPPGGNRSQEQRPAGPKPQVNPPQLKACRKVSQCGVGVGVMWPNPASPEKGTPVCTEASLFSTREPGDSHLLGRPRECGTHVW